MNKRFLIPAIGIMICVVLLIMFRGSSFWQEPVLRSGQELSKGVKSHGVSPQSVQSGLQSEGPTTSLATLPKPRELLQRLLAKYDDAVRRNRGPTWNMGKFQQESLFHLTEGRLLALAYPKETREWAGTIAGDRTETIPNRVYSVILLGYLSLTGDADARSSLFGIASQNTDPVSDRALLLLSQSDPLGSHRTLYWNKAREGTIFAIEALSYWPDPHSSDLLRAISGDPKAPEGTRSEVNLKAAAALDRLKLLQSPDFSTWLGEFLEAGNANQHALTHWALDVVRFQKPENLLSGLRRRLDRGKKQALDDHANRIADKLSGGRIPVDGNAFEASLISDREIGKYANDFYFDNILVAFLELGGTPLEWEKRRLYQFGYGCDPKKRLAELVTADSAEK